MNWLITGDTHFTDRPKDAYRQKLFPWLAKMQLKHDVDATFILGDMTEKKDNHSSTLVNSIIDGLIMLKPPVLIPRGNHDGVDPNSPYFKFLNCIQGLIFAVKPVLIKDLGVALIPHCRTQGEFDEACGIIPPKCPGVMLHQTFQGAIAETGATLAGLQSSPIELKRPLGVWAGDVHRPQTTGCVTYAGAPYAIRFGDDYQARVLLVKDGVQQNLYFPAPRKWTLTVRDADDLTRNEDLHAGDQVKLTIEMAREEVIEWNAHKQRVLAACKELGLEVYGVNIKVSASKRRERIKLGQSTHVKSPEDVLAEFCLAEGVASNVKSIGMELLK